MWGSEILEVAIGLVFVILVTSLAASALREIIESLLKTRAVELERGIRQLLDDPSGMAFTKDLYDHPLLYALFSGDYDPRKQLTGFRVLREQQSGLSQDGQPVTQPGQRLVLGSKLPSYVPSRNFALALMDVVGGTSKGGAPLCLESVTAGAMTLPEGRLREAMLVALGEAKGDFDRARASLEAWFDGTMDRVSGWYKRETQVILIGLGLGLAVVLNINSVSILQELWSNNTVRTELIARVDDVYPNLSAEDPDFAQEDVDKIQEGLTELIGWQRLSQEVNASLPPPSQGEEPSKLGTWAWHILASIPGWLITAVAVSLGAPFWFDVLNKLMVIRSTVKPYEKSPPEGSEDRRGPISPAATQLGPVPGDASRGPGGGGGLGGVTPGGISPGGAGMDGAGPGGAAASDLPAAQIRLALGLEGVEPGSASLTVDDISVPVPPDGFVELPLAVGVPHTLVAQARRGGSAVGWRRSIVPRLEDEAEPLDADLV